MALFNSAGLFDWTKLIVESLLIVKPENVTIENWAARLFRTNRRVNELKYLHNYNNIYQI